MADSGATSYYAYDPSHVAPAIFAALVGVSFLIHVYQVLYVCSSFANTLGHD